MRSRFWWRMLAGWMCVMIGVSGCACSPVEEGALNFQKQECRFTGVCQVKMAGDDLGDEYVVEILHRTDGSGELTFLSPETIAGCKYLRTSGGEYSFQAEDMIFPVGENPTTQAVFGLFSLSEDDIVKASTSKEKGEGVNVLTFDGGIRLYLDRHGMPLYYDHPAVTLTVHR